MALYDPNEFPAETVSTDFTLAEFHAWVKTKPASQRYCFVDAADCALGLFLRERRGLSASDCYADDRFFKPDFDKALARALNDSATFGELADRLEALSK